MRLATVSRRVLGRRRPRSTSSQVRDHYQCRSGNSQLLQPCLLSLHAPTLVRSGCQRCLFSTENERGKDDHGEDGSKIDQQLDMKDEDGGMFGATGSTYEASRPKWLVADGKVLSRIDFLSPPHGEYAEGTDGGSDGESGERTTGQPMEIKWHPSQALLDPRFYSQNDRNKIDIRKAMELFQDKNDADTGKSEVQGKRVLWRELTRTMIVCVCVRVCFLPFLLLLLPSKN